MFTFGLIVILDDYDVANNNSSSDRFGTTTTAELENVKRGGVWKSEASKRWATQSFDDWRRIQGLSIEKNLGELLEKADLKLLIDMLVRFMLETKK